MFKNNLVLNFIISSAVGLSIYLAQKTHLQLHWIVNNYINDFLIIPIVLSICLFVLRWLRNDKHFYISFILISYIVLFYTVFFEFIMPNMNKRYTADTIDFLMYAAGGFWFWWLQKNEFN